MSRLNRVPRTARRTSGWLAHVLTGPHEVRTHSGPLARAFEWARRTYLLHRHHRLHADIRCLEAGLHQDEHAVAYMRTVRRMPDPIVLSRITHERAELGRMRDQLTLVEHRLVAIGIRLAANDEQFRRVA